MSTNYVTKGKHVKEKRMRPRTDPCGTPQVCFVDEMRLTSSFGADATS